MDDLFSFSDDVIPSGVQNKVEAAKEATTSALDAVKGKVPGIVSKANNFDSKQVVSSVSVYADSVGSAALASLKKTFPKLEPQLGAVEPQLVTLVLVVAAGFFVYLVLINAVDSTVNPKAAGSSVSTSTTNEPSGTPVISSATNESRGTPEVSSATNESHGTLEVSSQQSVLPVSETSDPVMADVIELTDRNAIKSAGFIAFLVGYIVGGIWLGGALFVAASWAGTRRTDEVATAVKGVGRSGMKVINFGGYLEGKYKLTEQLGSGIANASVAVKEEYNQAGAVIDLTASVVGVVTQNEAAIKDAVDSVTMSATGAACLAGDAALQVLEKTVDALGELAKDSNKNSSQDTDGSQGTKAPATSETKQLPTASQGGSQGAKAPATSETEQLPTTNQNDAALSTEVRKVSTEQLPASSQESAVLSTKADKGSEQLPTNSQESTVLSTKADKGSEQLPTNSEECVALSTKADKGSVASTDSIIVDFSVMPVRFKVPATSRKEQVHTGAQEAAPSSSAKDKATPNSSVSVVDFSGTLPRFKTPAKNVSSLLMGGK